MNNNIFGVSVYDMQKIRETFLRIIEIPERFRVPESNYIIYKITNLKNNKVYIGSTNNIEVRASNYIADHFNDKDNGRNFRLVSITMKEEGIENFIMEPIAEAYNEFDAEVKEGYFIRIYRSTSIKYGYNVTSNTSRYNNPTRTRPIGIKHSIVTKTKKSKSMCMINSYTKEIILSVGNKLFGDYIGKSKDVVKNSARTVTKLIGYYVFYLNKEDLNRQKDTIINRYKNYNHIKSELVTRLQEIMELCKDIEDLIINSDDFTKLEEKYKVQCLVYSNDDKNGFNLLSLTEFLEIRGNVID